MKDLKSVLSCLRLKGVKLNLKKCFLFKREVKYLGRLVSEKGYRPDPENTKALDKCLVPPKTVGQLRAVIGFLGYYRTYVQNFSIKLKPVYDLLQGKTSKDKNGNRKQLDSRTKINWTDEHQAVIADMVNHLKSPAVISYPDFSSPFIIHCDASQSGLGAVLYQRKEDKKLKVISFASRTLSPAEKNYNLHSGKLEFLAMKWAVTERFRDYLINGPPFEVVTDNNPLTYVLTTAKLNATGLRWIAELANFRFTIRYRSGKKHIDADYLSRHALDDFEQWENETDKKVSSDDVNILFSSASKNRCEVNLAVVGALEVEGHKHERKGDEMTISAEELRQAQRDDPVIGPVVEILKGKELSAAERKLLNKDSKLLLKQGKKLSFVDGVLQRKTTMFTQIVLPKAFHNLVYQELHQKLSHLGSDKVLELARRRFYWPKMQHYIEYFIKNQCRCLIAKKPNIPEIAPLTSIQSTYPFEMVSLDYMHLDRAKGGYEYALVCIDHFTRFVQIYATKNKSGLTAADKMFNDLILRYGFPARIHHDQGREFDNHLFHRLEKLSGVRSSRTTAYHPQGNGQTERMNRSIIGMLKTLEQEEKKDWAKHLSKIAFAHNVTVSKSTGYSPHYLMLGRSPRLPIDGMFSVDPSEGDPKLQKSYAKYVDEWERAMNQAFTIANKNAGTSGERNKQYYDKRARGVEICIGDRVLLRNDGEKGGTGKLKTFWEDQVYVVSSKDPDVPVVTIKPEGSRKAAKRVHRNRVMKCNSLMPKEDVPQKNAEQKKVNRDVTPKRSEVKPAITVPKDKVKAPCLPSTKPEVDSESDEDLVLLVRDIAEQETVIQDDVEPSRQEEEVDDVDNSVVEEVVGDTSTSQSA